MKYLHLIRIRHWIKNLLILLPAVFSGKLFHGTVCFQILKGILAFSFVSSAVYVWNDLKDIEKDRNNPQKRNRPLASGTVTKKSAYILMILLVLAAGFIVCFGGLWKGNFWLCLTVYLLMNAAYSMGLKNVPIMDVAILSGGYLLRLYGGGELAETEISDWMFLTVAFAALYLGFGKRRNELVLYGYKGRKLLERYSVGFLDKGAQMSLTLTVVFYALSCTDENTVIAGAGALWSVVLLILLLLRYNMLLEDGIGDGDPVEVLRNDKTLIAMSVLYAVFVLALVYAAV